MQVVNFYFYNNQVTKVRTLFTISGLLFALLVNAQTGIVSTIAGDGYHVDNGDGGGAIQAEIMGAGGGIFDRHGNYYFVQENSKIRKISASGIMTTVAGTGNAGYNGDNILAINAELNYPKQFALDSVGNIYIADNGNYRVRKVDAATGIITTIAGNGTNTYSGDGNLAINAGLGYLSCICLDPFGNIYIGGAFHYIRKIDASGIITTYAGTGNIGFGGDGGLAINADIANMLYLLSDNSGNIYISAGNVRKIDASTHIITKVAGNDIYGYNGENLLADTTSIGAPYAMGFDQDNNLYLAEADNNRIRKIDASGFIHTVVGTGIGGYNGDGGASDTTQIFLPEGIAFDSCGNLYFNDLQNFRIRKVTFNQACATALAIKLLAFNGNAAGAANKLYWQTAGEEDIARFELQRSIDGKTFDKIGTIAKGNSLSYSYEDEELQEMSHYYRLKIIETGGGSSFSQVVRIIRDGSGGISLYPNPVKEDLTLSLSKEEGIQGAVAGGSNVQEVIILNTIGQVMIEQKSYSSKAVIDVSALSTGIYFIKVIDSSGAEVVKRFLKE